MVIRELASGVDALYLSAWVRLDSEHVAALTAAKERAHDSIQTVELAGETFTVLGHGWGRYRFAAEHPNALVGFSPDTKLPPVRVQLRASYLHAVGASAAVAWVREVLSREFREAFLRVSRVDVFADWQGWTLQGDDRSAFVGWASALNTYERDGRFCGFVFGRRANGMISARIYDKTLEVADKGGAYWHAVWGERYRQDAGPVVRVEFELGRTILRALKLDEPEQVLAALPRLWAYLTDEWLTYRIPGTDGTRSRWPLHPIWETVQQPSFRENAVGIERVKEARRTFDLRRILPPLMGYLASFGVVVGGTDLRETVALLYEHLRSYEKRTSVSFIDRMTRKRVALRSI